MVSLPANHPHMDAITYKIIHLIGISLLAIGVGGMMANGSTRKTFAICQGLGLLVMLVSGFGLLTKLGLGLPHFEILKTELHPEGERIFRLGIPHFAIVKTVLWLVIGMLPMIFKKLKPPLGVAIVISLTLVGIMAWLGVMKPALW